MDKGKEAHRSHTYIHVIVTPLLFHCYGVAGQTVEAKEHQQMKI